MATFMNSFALLDDDETADDPQSLLKVVAASVSAEKQTAKSVSVPHAGREVGPSAGRGGRATPAGPGARGVGPVGSGRGSFHSRESGRPNDVRGNQEVRGEGGAGAGYGGGYRDDRAPMYGGYGGRRGGGFRGGRRGRGYGGRGNWSREGDVVEGAAATGPGEVGAAPAPAAVAETAVESGGDSKQERGMAGGADSSGVTPESQAVVAADSAPAEGAALQDGVVANGVAEEPKQSEEELAAIAAAKKEKEDEEKQMTLDEYEKLMEEKRKALQVDRKAGSRKVEVDAELAKMTIKKKVDAEADDVFIKLGAEKDKPSKKRNEDQAKPKAVNINDFLKPPEGQTFQYRQPRGGFRGGRAGRTDGRFGSYGGGGFSGRMSNIPIKDQSQFPTLG